MLSARRLPFPGDDENTTATAKQMWESATGLEISIGRKRHGAPVYLVYELHGCMAPDDLDVFRIAQDMIRGFSQLQPMEDNDDDE